LEPGSLHGEYVVLVRHDRMAGERASCNCPDLTAPSALGDVENGAYWALALEAQNLSRALPPCGEQFAAFKTESGVGPRDTVMEVVIRDEARPPAITRVL
jgi:hypothetical protein